jgi:peroxiredoxin Q/BCP
MPMPAAGSPAPTFELPATAGGGRIGLSDYLGKTVVLYFYPKADTPGCTTEACGFRDALAEYDRSKVIVLGISPDPLKDVQKFADKLKLNFPLLADAEHKVAERYGVWGEKSMYGKTYMGVSRVTFVIDKSGDIAHVFDKVKPAGHDQEVLAWIKANEKK